MAATLHEILLTEGTGPKVVADCTALIEAEVADMTGLSGAAVKLAYKTLTAFRPGYVSHMITHMLPDLLGKLEPHWAGFAASGGGGFGDYLAKRGDEVAQQLLEVTDQKAAESGKPILVKAYRGVRAGAARHIVAALPRAGEIVDAYAA